MFDFIKTKSFRFEYLVSINAKTQDVNINKLRSNYSKDKGLKKIIKKS